MIEKYFKLIVLAAGMGTRLLPYTQNMPKCLVEINGKSLLDYQLEIIKSLPIEEVVLVGGYKSQLLVGRGDKLILNDDFEHTNMVHSLFCAESELSGDVLISYGDIVYAREAAEAIIQSEADIAVVVDENWWSYWKARFVHVLDDAETLALANEGQIVDIGGKPQSVEEIDGQYIGLIKLSSKGVENIKKTYQWLCGRGEYRGRAVQALYITDLLQAAIDLGFIVQSVPIRCDWIEVDSVSDLNLEVTHTRLRSIILA